MSQLRQFAQNGRRLLVSIRWAVAFSAIVVVSAGSARALEIIDLGTLAGGTFSGALGVSENRVVTGDSDAAGTNLNSRAFRYQNGVMTNLGTLPGDTYSVGSGISANGSVIVGYSMNDNFDTLGFRYESGTMTALNPLAGHDGSSGNGVSANGAVAVGSSFSSSTGALRAVRWQAGVAHDLGELFEDGNSDAYGVSADGSTIVGHADVIDSVMPFVWTAAEGMTALDLPDAYDAGFAQAVSADGSVIVGNGLISTISAERAFMWTEEGRVDLGTVGASTYSSAYGVSADGFLVVGGSGTDTEWGAAIWDDTTRQMRDLKTVLTEMNASGIGDWDSLTMANAVSGNALTGYDIVGWGTIGGSDRAFMVTGFMAVPEPSGIIFGSIAAAAIVWSARRRVVKQAPESKSTANRPEMIPEGRRRQRSSFTKSL